MQDHQLSGVVSNARHCKNTAFLLSIYYLIQLFEAVVLLYFVSLILDISAIKLNKSVVINTNYIIKVLNLNNFIFLHLYKYNVKSVQKIYYRRYFLIQYMKFEGHL